MQGLKATTIGCFTRSSANTVIISVGSAHGTLLCFNVILITCSKRSDAALCDICNYKVLSTPLRSATTFGSAVGNSFSSSPSGCCQLKESLKNLYPYQDVKFQVIRTQVQINSLSVPSSQELFGLRVNYHCNKTCYSRACPSNTGRHRPRG